MAPIGADQLLRDLGRRFAEVRTTRGLTQDAMAEFLGISTKYLQRLERGRSMSLRTLIDFANRLEVTLKELLLTKPRALVTRVGRPPKPRRGR